MGSSFVGCPTGHGSWSFTILIYINDISTDIESKIKLFADEYFCYREIKKIEDTVKPTRRMGKEMGYEIPTRQIEYNAADKKGTKKSML